jgi:hypothetical protein
MPRSGKLDYKVNSLSNVTEIYSEGFNLTMPCGTHQANTMPEHGVLEVKDGGYF